MDKKENITVKIVTKEKIEKYLKKIGWKLVHHGCDHYMFYNCYGDMTNLCLVFGERIEEEAWGKPGLFGSIKETKSFHNGSMAFYLKHIIMEYSYGTGYPSVTFFPKGTKNVWLSLYDTREEEERG